MTTRTIGALWVRKSKAGVTYMSGMLNDISGDIKIAIFKNNRKEKDSQPDYQIVLSQPTEQKRAADSFMAPAETERPNSFGEGGFATKAEIEGPGEIPVVEDVNPEDIDVAKIPF